MAVSNIETGQSLSILNDITILYIWGRKVCLKWVAYSGLLS